MNDFRDKVVNDPLWAADEITRLELYVRQLEDACIVLYSELPSPEWVILTDETPQLAQFLIHLHHTIEHEQATVRLNVWAQP